VSEVSFATISADFARWRSLRRPKAGIKSVGLNNFLRFWQ